MRIRSGGLNWFADRVLFGIDAWLVSEDDLEIAPVEGISLSIVMDADTEALDRLDGKAGSLLTHISMMIAAATFMVSSASTSYLENVVIGIEVTIYIFLALLCVRCLAFTTLIPTRGLNTLHQYRADLRREVQTRSLILNFCVRWVFIVTFIFMLTVLAHLVL